MSGSCISSTSHGIRDWLATGLIMPISCESLSLRSAAVPQSSIPEWAVPRGPLAIDGLISATHVEAVPDCSLIARACGTDSSPSAHSLALVWSCFSVPGVRADSSCCRSLAISSIECNLPSILAYILPVISSTTKIFVPYLFIHSPI